MGPRAALLSLGLLGWALPPGGGFMIQPSHLPLVRSQASLLSLDEHRGRRHLGASLSMCTSAPGPAPPRTPSGNDWKQRMGEKYQKESNRLRSVDEALGFQILTLEERICVPGARGHAEGGPDFVAPSPVPELAQYDNAGAHMCKVALCAQEEPSLHAKLLREFILPDQGRMRLLLHLLDSELAESIIQVAPWALQRAYIETKGRLTSLASMPMYPEGVSEEENPLLKACISRIMSPQECDEVVQDAEDYAAREGWTTSRHEDSPTTDVPIRSLPKAGKLWEEAISPRIKLAMAQNFGFKEDDIQPVDVFVVKYRHDQQRELLVHRDGAIMTFSLLLNDAEDFEGGGTYFEESGRVYRPRKGVAVLHSGKRRHGGYPISAGTRYILVGFCWVNSPLLADEMRTWQVGLPGWYVNSKASSDAEILDRVFSRHNANGPGIRQARASEM